MSNDLIEKRDERTRRRKRMKRRMDSIIGLSFHDKEKRVKSLCIELSTASDSRKARLLDEGYIDNGFVIKKGTLEKYLSGQNQYVRGWEFNGEEWEQTEVLNLTSDFTGTVNLGHMDFATFPILLGSWTRDDLELVETENERHALDITLHLDEESVFIKELRRQNHDIGISAEFWYHVNEEDTQSLSETLGYFLPVLDEIFIFAYGLVGECGNVNSSGLELNAKETEMPNEENMVLDTDLEEEITEAEELSAEDEISIEPTEEVIEEPEIEQVSAEEDFADEAEEEPEEEADEESEEAEVEEVSEEESEDDEDESEEADPYAETLSALQTQIDALNNTIRDLTEQNTALKKSNRKLSNKLQKENEKKEQFMQNVKGLSVQLLPDDKADRQQKETQVSDRSYLRGDGIGEI